MLQGTRPCCREHVHAAENMHSACREHVHAAGSTSMLQRTCILHAGNTSMLQGTLQGACSCDMLQRTCILHAGNMSMLQGACPCDMRREHVHAAENMHSACREHVHAVGSRAIHCMNAARKLHRAVHLHGAMNSIDFFSEN